MSSETAPHNVFLAPVLDLCSNRKELHRMQRTPSSKMFIHSHHSHFEAHELMKTANELVEIKGRGIYASDEAPEMMDELLRNAQKVSLTEEEKRKKRKIWKETAFSSLNSEYISGAILHWESLIDFQLAPLLSDKGIIPGIRANGELVPIPRSTEEFIVQGLDNLLPQLQAARSAGARFSKWRVPVGCTSTNIPVPLPTLLGLETSAETLAQFAAISQQAGLVPIVEPDVDFSRDADLARSTEVHERVIDLIYIRMKAHGVLIEGTLIKPSFPQPGLQHPSRAEVAPEEIAMATATIISRSVPTSVQGVLFLSGGLPSQTATNFLASLNALVLASPSPSAFSRLPRLTFSFGRGIQNEAMELWKAGDENAAKESFEKWSRSCWHASKGVVL
ncbi:aldolase [Crepidotus variabilis]|uniref:fructose-bisphosphate aldolase n=1 Tax=Crepidotus variabilis TaxID=179855 RepID=A0A9P6JUN2_9AGAR|nr:aldolase [Crepidotus variabilis]